ncbi:hypothetical protein MKX03_011300, partial [Papaver bracteatum]
MGHGSTSRNTNTNSSCHRRCESCGSLKGGCCDKVNKLKEKLQEKEDELEDMEALNQALIIKERRTNDELQEARKELIR